MKDKKLILIFLELFIGVVLMIPIKIFSSDGTVWFVIMKLLYSFGIMLTMTKIMSILCRMISCIFKGIMLLHQKLYWVLYFIFICFGVVVWNLYSNIFANGYFVVEIIAYILFAFWFLLDIHTTKCFWSIKFLYELLNSELEDHRKFVMEYKNNIINLSNRKDILLQELEVYFPKKNIRDPLKELRKDIDLLYVDKYMQRIPSFQGKYKGLEGFLYGQEGIKKFENAIAHYLENLVDDRQWMDSENQIYDSYISEMEKMVATIKKDGKRIQTLDDLGFDSSKFRGILERDIADAENNRKSIKQLWKMNKKINKMRRKNYGR